MTMEIKKIKTPQEYDAAIEHLELLGDREDFQENRQIIEEFELVSTLVALYEKENFALNIGHPLEIIKQRMAALGIQRKDLVPLIGSSGVVSEVFNKKRGLSKEMIRKLSCLLNIEQDILNLEYPTEPKSVKSVEKNIPKIEFVFIKSMQVQVSYFRNCVKQNGMLFNINAA
jgi:HTH-type transcriptional regulator/antitoxin HigA